MKNIIILLLILSNLYYLFKYNVIIDSYSELSNKYVLLHKFKQDDYVFTYKIYSKYEKLIKKYDKLDKNYWILLNSIYPNRIKHLDSIKLFNKQRSIYLSSKNMVLSRYNEFQGIRNNLWKDVSSTNTSKIFKKTKICTQYRLPLICFYRWETTIF